MSAATAPGGAVRLRSGRWGTWFRSWERQQESYNRARERRFTAMLDIVAASVPPRFVALDLGCGPGSLSYRLLRRFPQARCVAVDFDPVVLRIGQGALGTAGGRLTWTPADLRDPGWSRALPVRRFDVALSTTALHWLEERTLARLYRDLSRYLRPGGIFLDGDRFPWGSKEPVLARLAERVRSLGSGAEGRKHGWDRWRAWWAAAERDPELRPLFAERERSGRQHPKNGDASLAFHRRALLRAGFSPVEVVWRSHENGILYARR